MVEHVVPQMEHRTTTKLRERFRMWCCTYSAADNYMQVGLKARVCSRQRRINTAAALTAAA